MSRQVIEDAFDDASDGEPIVLAQSWQAWSITHRSYMAGRTDLKAREVHFATYPNFAPTRAELETRARQCGFRYAMLQHYAGVVGDRLKLISEDTELFDFASSGADAKPESAPVVERDNPAQTISAATDAVRRMKELERELTPEHQQRGEIAVTREDIEELIEAAISKIQPTPVREKSELERLRELMEFQRELQMQVAQNAPAPKSEISDKERLVLALNNELDVTTGIFSKWREALGTAEHIDEPPTLASQVFGFLRDGVAPYVMPIIAPSVGAKLVAMLNTVDDGALAQAVTQQQQQAHAAQAAALPQPIASPVVSPVNPKPPQAQAARSEAQPSTTASAPETNEASEAEDDAPMTLNEVLENLFNDMEQNAPVEDCAKELLALAEDNPMFTTTIQVLMGAPPETVLQMLNDASQNKLTAITGAAHAPEWVSKLQTEMRRLAQPDVAGASAAQSGSTIEQRECFQIETS